MMPSAAIQRRRKKTKYPLAALSKEFADSTSLHGLKFISQPNASKSERILWSVLCIIGFLFGLVWSWILWNNWSNNPVLTTVQSANIAINSRHFPAVTICSVNKISTKYLGSWMETRPEAKTFQLNEIRRILGIIGTNQVENENDMLILSSLMNKANLNSYQRGYEKLASAVSPKCSDMTVFCSWESKEQNCTDMFAVEATDDGYCCSFNSVIATKDGGAVQSSKELVYARTSGVYAGFTVILNAQLDDYNFTSSSTNGFKFSIQAPDDMPATGKIGFLASPGTQVDVAVTGQMQVADDESIKHINKKHRMCATKNEIKLKYFDEYTKHYCQMDCLARSFMASCRCIPYYFPISDAVLPSCNISAYICLEKTMGLQIGNTSACNCPELCNSVWYRSEISRGSFPNPVAEYPPSIKRRPDFVNMTEEEFKLYAKDNFVKLNIFFKSLSGLGYIMDHRTNWADFISATGGLLVLGFGFSLLGGIEFLYFFCIRWMYHWYHKNDNQPDQDDEESHHSSSRPRMNNTWMSPENKRHNLTRRPGGL